jgi:hypothetical protein
MALQNPGIPSAANLTNMPSGAGTPSRQAPATGRFGQVLAQVTPGTGMPVQVQRGDTLIGLVKAQHRQQGLTVTENQAFKLAHQVAAGNRLSNPDLIRPGQRIDLKLLAPSPSPATAKANAPTNALELAPPASAALAQQRAPTPPSDIPTPAIGANTENHAVLDQVLGRAVSKGFIPTSDLAGVRNKIVALSDKHSFEPDDFARLSLMESGGMNPKASNGHCHGIIQFCDGPARGAAAVGFQNNAKAILGMSLFKQLDLVDQYFSKVGRPPKAGKQGLDDLYLGILSPAARSETRADAPLAIGGPQASLLHVGGNQRNPITRTSLLNGLRALSDMVLSPTTNRRGPAELYAEVAKPSDSGTAW